MRPEASVQFAEKSTTGEFSSLRHISALKQEDSVPSASECLRFGENLEKDPRLSNIVTRERFLLSVIIPRFRTFKDVRREWWKRTAHPMVWIPCLLVVAMHVGLSSMCRYKSSSGICAGGPEDNEKDDDDSKSYSSWVFTEYGPPVINALATLMLSFYANVCMTLYKVHPIPSHPSPSQPPSRSSHPMTSRHSS
jgi:hypothetical protein